MISKQNMIKLIAKIWTILCALMTNTSRRIICNIIGFKITQLQQQSFLFLFKKKKI